MAKNNSRGDFSFILVNNRSLKPAGNGTNASMKPPKERTPNPNYIRQRQ